MKAPRAAQELVLPKRCAVYARVSDDERLDLDYNSLQAQRDACLAYVTSQRFEGWRALDDTYEDGGFSAGTLERPGLKRLLADVRAGKVDTVVVYKIDRLTRSLRDFFRLHDLFEEHNVAFVSVTQQFNTATAMGRLMLNTMLSFAQFEREQGAERVRDKVAASKAKGIWMGGVPPLGYDVRERKLVVNEREAALVREIFDSYAADPSVVRLVRELEVSGHTTKAWVTQGGRVRKGRPIDQQFLFKLLRNRVYLGEITHRGQAFPGQHQAIVEREVWDRVQAAVDARKRSPSARKTDRPALLAGLLFAPDGQRMQQTSTRKRNGRVYRYYVPYAYKRRHAQASAAESLPLGPLAAGEIEAAVLQQVHEVLLRPEMCIATLRSCQQLPEGARIDEAQVAVALRRVGDVWERLFPGEQQRILQLLIERVQLLDVGMEIIWHDAGWARFAAEFADQPFVQESRMQASKVHR